MLSVLIQYSTGETYPVQLTPDRQLFIHDDGAQFVQLWWELARLADGDKRGMDFLRAAVPWADRLMLTRPGLHGDGRTNVIFDGRLEKVMVGGRYLLLRALTDGPGPGRAGHGVMPHDHEQVM